MKKSHTSETETASTPATYQDVLNAPPHMVAEVIDGTLYTHPRPHPKHISTHSRLGMKIGPPFEFGDDGPGGWWILDEPELHLNQDIVVPDLAGWRRERMRELPNEAYFTLVPDWVCEVLSPSTRKIDLGAKRAIYAREGVKFIWFVDPVAQSLEAFQLLGARWVLIDKLFDNASVSLPPFEAVCFDLNDLWPPPTVHKALPESVPEPMGAAK